MVIRRGRAAAIRHIRATPRSYRPRLLVAEASSGCCPGSQGELRRPRRLAGHRAAVLLRPARERRNWASQFGRHSLWAIVPHCMSGGFEYSDSARSAERLGPTLKLERADRDVVSVRISDRELLRSSIRVEMWFFFEPRHQPAGPLQCKFEIVDAKEQEEAIAWCSVIGTHQGGVLVVAPLVQAQQDSSIRVE